MTVLELIPEPEIPMPGTIVPVTAEVTFNIKPAPPDPLLIVPENDVKAEPVIVVSGTVCDVDTV